MSSPTLRTTLRATALTVVRDDKRLLDAVTLELFAGTLVAVVGENGAGKTTLLDVLAGVSAPTSGTVVVDGHDLSQLSPRARAQMIASAGQHAPRVFDLKVVDRIGQGLAPRRGSRAFLDDTALARVQEISKIFAVDSLLHRQLGTLSGGERARVEIARVLADVDAAVVIVDEPLANVDVRHRGPIMDALVARANAGTLVIACIHDLGLAFAAAHVVIGLKNGRVIKEGPPAQVLSPAGIRDLFEIDGEVVEVDGKIGALMATR